MCGDYVFAQPFLRYCVWTITCPHRLGQIAVPYDSGAFDGVLHEHEIAIGRTLLRAIRFKSNDGDLRLGNGLTPQADGLPRPDNGMRIWVLAIRIQYYTTLSRDIGRGVATSERQHTKAVPASFHPSSGATARARAAHFHGFE